MGLFGKSDDSSQSNSFWNRLTKPRKQQQKSTTNSAPTNHSFEQQQKHSKVKTCVNRISEDPKKDNFRLSLPSLRVRAPSISSSVSQNRASAPATEQLDSRLRTSKLQCEQLKKKVASISLECSKLESQCREISEVKEQLFTFQADITMLKRKEKVYSEIQQRIAHLEEENYAMIDQIEHLRVMLSDLKTEISPEFVYKRLDQLESDSQKLTAITIQNRRDHDRFSLDVGNQLVETFVTQQTIYEEFRRLQHRLVSVERQNQIMSDLIHFHCHNSSRTTNHPLMINSSSSKGAVSLQASTEAASSSFSPIFSDRDAEKTYMSPSNIDWQFTDQGDSLFLDDTLNKSTDGNHELIIGDHKNKDYYKIDFTSKSDSLTTLQMTDLSAALSVSIISMEEVVNSPTIPTNDDIQETNDHKTNANIALLMKCNFEKKEGCSTVNHQRDDGYYSTSHDGTIATDSVFTQGTITIFQDNKERYLILTKHVQKSNGRSVRSMPLSNSQCAIVVKSSMDLESQIFNRRLRQRQHKQRDSQVSNEDEINQVFSDTELYGTRFCIDSDIDDDENTDIFPINKMKPLKRSFGYATQKSIKIEPKHISNLPPLIENVSERERKIEIKSSKRSKIVPPKVKAKTNIPQSPSMGKFPNKLSLQVASNIYSDEIGSPKKSLSIKPPKYIPLPRAPKVKSPEYPESSVNLLSPRKMPVTEKNINPPPIPPRPKKTSDIKTHDISYKNVTTFDYVNDPTTRMSPEGCQDLSSNNSNIARKFRDYHIAPKKWSNNFSPTPDDCYNEDEEEVQIIRPDNYEEYFDQEFISELENYQLPKSSVNMLVMQHFK